MLDELQQVQVSPLVGSHAELAPYLAGLNLDEALVGFERLADLVLTPSPPPADDQQQQQDSLSSVPSSPGGTSYCASSRWLSSPSSTSFSSVSSSLSFSRYSGSSCSSPNSSAASSVCGDQPPTTSSRRRRPRTLGLDNLGHSGGGVQKPQPCERRRQNATAAERYRRKLKGRRCGLEEELERERERNARLMASFESKLALYREFADLLAANTRDPRQDHELALLGRRSLSNILERICPAQFLAKNERQRVELERLHEHFRRVLSVASAVGPLELGQAQLAY